MMKFFFAPAILTLVAAPPAVHAAWNLAPSLFPATPWSILPPTRQHQRAIFLQQHLSQQLTSPRYELLDNDEKFQLTVDVPGVKKEDIDIRLQEGLLTIRGYREAKDEKSLVTSQFSQTFYLDPSIDVEKFTANLEKGVLVVTAPKDMKKLEENVRKIPIMRTKEYTITSVPEESEKVDVRSIMRPFIVDDTLEEGDIEV
jgi:HSP20 family molecular chaperone IbpA